MRKDTWDEKHDGQDCVYYKNSDQVQQKLDQMGHPIQISNKKPRLLVRLGIFLMSHSTVVSILCAITGVVALLLLPVLAKNTYISENALMPGSANPFFSGQDVSEANNLIKELQHMKLKSREKREVLSLIAEHIRELGAEVYYHEFQSPKDQFNPLQFFSGTYCSSRSHENNSYAPNGVNTVGIVRAPRGDGKEAIILVTPYNSEETKLSDAFSLGLAYSIFSHLSRVSWLAKDIVWLVSDSRYGEYASVASWLREYHNPDFLSGLDQSDVHMDSHYGGRRSVGFKRAGTMAAAVVFKIVDREEDTETDTLKIYAEASNGQMPNLDLINIVNYLAAHRQGFRVKVASVSSLVKSAWLKILGQVLEWLSEVAERLNPQWKFAIPVMDYVEGTATLASSMYYQALGVPTGSHGAFRDYQVDAITLEISPKIPLNKETGKIQFILRSGRLIEGVIRSVNNLLEKFHQSFFLYFLTSSGKFVSVGVYMIAFALLVAPLPVVAAALYSDSTKGDCTAEGPKASTDTFGALGSSWRWLHAAKVVLMVHLWAVSVSLLPYLINQLPKKSSTFSMLAWFFLSAIILLILYQIFGFPYSVSSSSEASPSDTPNWTILKALMIAAASIGLALMSVINFATAQIGALVVVPMCLIAHPLKHLSRSTNYRSVLLLACNLALAIIAFPPAALFMLKSSSLLTDFSPPSIGVVWEWTESLWVWNSATYLYILLVHLPCWVLYMHVLLHPMKL
ncbi:hypothetical protein H6P81_001795 [Aristolochia fimbriata]|uniref:Glycosylphosphatidylinositol anchor attachment 1 protein n=1 Tax=Aristolochia fimbriata TaxID=158543 RepID=A0AAV7FB62_ARIFI|nr:hypothetical protein H6P81_001795 [Aristolochia fimbriata]